MNDIDLILMKSPYEYNTETVQLFKELEKSRKDKGNENKWYKINLEKLTENYTIELSERGAGRKRRENNVN